MIEFDGTPWVAVVSTAHIRTSDAALLARCWREGSRNDCDIPPYPVMACGPYCALATTSIGLESTKDSESPWSSALLNVLREAAKAGYAYVLFDRDALAADGLPTFEWGE